MLEAGLVARKAAVVNWDPVDMTVLANEQVIDGKGWRSGAPVERRELTQWFFRISDMAEELLEALDGLEHWPEKVRTMQRNWIGKSRGLQFRFETRGAPARASRRSRSTPRGRTRSGARASPRSRRSIRWPGRWRATRRSRRSSPSAGGWAPARRSSRPPRSRATTPASGWCIRSIPSWELPVYIANFILMDYGTGAIFGCPAHDQRDLDFARKYGLPVIDVFAAPGSAARVGTEAYVPPKAEPVAFLLPVAGARS